MFAPVVSRFMTYDIALDARLGSYADAVWRLPAMCEWRRKAGEAVA